MKKLVVLSIIIILLINISYAELKPGILTINNIIIPFEVKEKIKEKSKSTFYIYANSQRIAKKENNKLYYFYNDHLGSPRAISDDEGNIIWKGDYLPFGEVFNEEGSNDIKYNSKELDFDTKLMYYGARYYKPEIGRFITADTVEVFPNAYVYVSNNPLKYIDPIGEQARLSYDIKKQLKKYGINPNELIRRSKLLSSINKKIRTPITLEERDYMIERGAVGMTFSADSSVVRTIIFKTRYQLIGTILHEAAHLTSPFKSEKGMIEAENEIFNSISNLKLIGINYDNLLDILEEIRATRLAIKDVSNLNNIIDKKILDKIIKVQKFSQIEEYNKLEKELNKYYIINGKKRALTESEKQRIKDKINELKEK